MQLHARGRVVRFPRRPLVMGIVNINDDSFSGDGRLDSAWALERAAELVAQGADIVDVGAESARTNREAIPPGVEIERLLPFVDGFRAAMRGSAPLLADQIFPPLLSINTWRPEVAAALLTLGGDILNDLSGLASDQNARICAQDGASLVILHTRGAPKVRHTHVRYDDVVAEVGRFFSARSRAARAAGLPSEHLIFDPGIDFAKQRDDNLAVLRELGALAALGRPVLVPVSRKTVIGDVLDLPDPRTRDAGTVACTVAGALRGGAIFRVHNVEACVQALRTIQALRDA